jgi:hypothetical protein
MNSYLNLLVAFQDDWDSELWQNQAQYNCCMGHSHSTKVENHCLMIYFALYTSVYDQISPCNCSIFSHNISLSEILGQATYRTWWKHFDQLCCTYSFFCVLTCFHCSDCHQPLSSSFIDMCVRRTDPGTFRATHTLSDSGLSRASIPFPFLISDFVICLTVPINPV